MKRLFSFFLMLLFVAACSGPAEPTTDKADDKESQTTESETKKEKDSEPMKEETTGPVTLNLYTVGETMQTMKYEPNRLEVPAGAEVKLTLQNKAESEAMIHNAVIIKAGKQTPVTEAALEAGPDKDYLPESPHIIAATKLANPGETVEITFTAPDKPGTYQYICTYPGHTAMKGVLLVK